MLMSPTRPHNVTPGMQTRRLDRLIYPVYAAMFAQTHEISFLEPVLPRRD